MFKKILRLIKRLWYPEPRAEWYNYPHFWDFSMDEPAPGTLTQELLDSTIRDAINATNDMETTIAYNQRMYYSGTVTSGVTMDELTTTGNQVYTSSTPSGPWVRLDDFVQEYEMDFNYKQTKRTKHTTKQKQASFMKYLVGDIDAKELSNIIKN